MKDTEKRVILRDTSEKYSAMVQEIVPPILELLEAITELEEATYEKYEKMEAEKQEMGLPRSQVHPNYMKFMDDYQKRYGELVSVRCTEKLLKRPYGRSFRYPAKYAYVSEAQIYFSMKSAKKAVIETEYQTGINLKHRFVLRNEDGVWKIDEIKYGFYGNEEWYIDQI